MSLLFKMLLFKMLSRYCWTSIPIVPSYHGKWSGMMAVVFLQCLEGQSFSSLVKKVRGQEQWVLNLSCCFGTGLGKDLGSFPSPQFYEDPVYCITCITLLVQEGDVFGGLTVGQIWWSRGKSVVEGKLARTCSYIQCCCCVCTADFLHLAFWCLLWRHLDLGKTILKHLCFLAFFHLVGLFVCLINSSVADFSSMCMNPEVIGLALFFIAFSGSYCKTWWKGGNIGYKYCEK